MPVHVQALTGGQLLTRWRKSNWLIPPEALAWRTRLIVQPLLSRW
jgi:hypothetical protein